MRLTERLAFVGFLLSILFGMLVPIYTDEVGWRMQERAWVDGGVDRMINDICGPGSIVAPPLFMMPLRALSGVLNSTFPDPLYVRVVGVGCALLWAFMLRGLISRIARDKAQCATLTALAFGLLGLGVLPMLLVLSRPEQPILLTSTMALLIATTKHRDQMMSRCTTVLRATMILLLGAAAAAYHMKGVLFLPLFLVCIFFSSRGKNTLLPRVAAILLLIALNAQAAHYWVERFRCPGDSVLAADFAKLNMASAMVGPGDWESKAAKAIRGANPNNYVALALAQPHPMSSWLPANRVTLNEAMARYFPVMLPWNAALLLSLFCLFRTLGDRWREKRIDLTVAVPIVMSTLVLVWGVTQLVKNVYEASLMLPALMLFIVFSLIPAKWNETSAQWLRGVVSIIVLVSLLGQADMVLRFGSPLLRAAEHPGYVEGQPFSASAFGYAAVRDKIRQTAHLCHIGTHGRARHPLIDDVTYFAMSDGWQPFHRLGVLSEWNGSIHDPMAYLRAKKSDGAIVGCRYLTDAQRRLALQNGEFCCLPTG